ncbi:MAG: DOMON-like domain-containing protein [Methylacidiphilales bacterium]|nr:DOMON-like domain-containing protein [Candidatus Methylacidiphilales bacterium]
MKITGNLARNENLLIISFALTGNITEVEIPSPSDNPTRKNQLWEQTCFEFFIGIKNSPRYWEFNLSPTEDWNLYSFDGYRQGMQEETAFSTLPFSIYQSDDCFAIALDFDLSKIIPNEQVLDVAIASVIQSKNNQITYWALTHCAEEADFHQRSSFILDLAVS